MSDSEQLETGDEYGKSYWQSLFRGCKCLRGGQSLFRFISAHISTISTFRCCEKPFWGIPCIDGLTL